MGFFDALAPQIKGAIAGSAGQAITGAFGRLFDTAGLSGLSRQESAQKRLNIALMREQHRLNEESAKAAYERQLSMYERSLKDNSPAERRKRLEEAGLSVGLMSSGGAAGTIGSGQGGISPGAQATTSGIGSALQAEKIATTAELASIAKTNAETKLLEAEAEEKKQNASQTNMSKAYFAERLRQEGIERWLANELKMYFMENDKDDPNGGTTFANLRLEEGTFFNIHSKEHRETFLNLLKTECEAEEAAGNANAANSLALLNNEKTKWIYLEMVAALLQGKAAYANALANKIQAETNKQKMKYEYGEEWTTKTIIDEGLQVAGTVIDAIAVGQRASLGKRAIEEAGRRWEGDMQQRMAEEEGRNARSRGTEREVTVVGNYSNGEKVITKTKTKNVSPKK